MNQNKKAAQGVGILIIFIALVLVSGIAAAVLVQTATGLQSQSTGVGNQVEEKTTKGIEVVQVTVSDVSDGTINETADILSVLTRLSLGSGPINLDNLLISMDSNSNTALFEVNSGGLPNPIYYDVTYLSNGGTPITDGYIQRGELVRIEIISPVNITESEKFEVGFLGNNIQSTIYDVTTPNAMVQNTVQLYP